MSTKQATGTRSPQSPRPFGPLDLEEAEAALVENYPRLVRLAYLTLPPAMGRHRRVLAAHAIVQRALPRPRPRGDGGRQAADSAYGRVREQVLRGALRYEQRSGRQRLLDRVLPQVWGLRLHPKAGSTDEGTLDRALSALNAEARAAYALREVEGLGEGDARRLLAAAGVVQTGTAVGEAARADQVVGLEAGGDFDPCTVQARPTDLLRRRQLSRLGLAAVAVLTSTGLLVGTVGGGEDAPDTVGLPGPYASNAAAFLDPAKLNRAGATGWTSTSRLDFTAWPARGGRTDDRELLGRALAAWADPGGRVTVTTTAGTAAGLPAGRPQLLYAGDVDGSAVVMFHDGMRIVRYAEPLDDDTARNPATLDFARVDGADLASATAVIVSRTDGNARFLTAPWVTGTLLTDLLRPTEAGQALRRSVDGVTDLVRMPGLDSSCDTWPALRFTVSARAGGHPPFLLTDLGDLVPIHLAYRTAEGAGPVEATGPLARASWARTACRLAAVRGQGARTVTGWEYAHQTLPEGEGEASWVCARAETWHGTGRALALFAPPGSAPATLVGRSGGATDSCGGAGPHVLAGVLWKSAAGRWYLLAAGGPGTTRIRATGQIRATAPGARLAVRAKPGTRARVTAVLGSGRMLTTLR